MGTQNMLKKIRTICASAIFVLITALFLDFTGTIHAYLGWLAKIQFLPAVLSFNILAIILILLITLAFGRIYCSIICPLGVFQDGISHMAGKKKKTDFIFIRPTSFYDTPFSRCSCSPSFSAWAPSWRFWHHTAPTEG